MKIRALMVPDPITIHKGADIGEAIELMKVNSIRHLPVISTDNDLVGFVTLADLKQGLIPSMVGDLSLEDLMIKDPITVGPDESYVLREGDTIQFALDEGYICENIGEESCDVLSIAAHAGRKSW